MRATLIVLMFFISCAASAKDPVWLSLGASDQVLARTE